MNKHILPYILMSSLFACCVEMDMMLPSFPSMKLYFKTSQHVIQLTVAINVIGVCIAAMFYGPISDCYGRRKVMVFGNSIMFLASLLCSISENIYTLLFARFVQGIGAATSTVLVLAIVGDVFNEKKSVMILGLLNALLTIFVAIAPVIGVFIHQYWGWRGNFIAITIVCFISLMLLVFFLEETKKEFHPFSFVQVIKDYKKILSDSLFISTSLIPSLLTAGYMVFIISSPFIYIESMGLSIFNYAIHQSLIIITYSMSSMFGYKLIERCSEHRLLVVCNTIILFTTGIFILTSAIMPFSYYSITLLLMVISPAVAILYLLTFSQLMSIYPENKGAASSVMFFIRALVVGGSIAVSSSFFTGHSLSVAISMMVIFCIAAITTTKFTYYKKQRKQVLQEEVS